MTGSQRTEFIERDPLSFPKILDTLRKDSYELKIKILDLKNWIVQQWVDNLA